MVCVGREAIISNFVSNLCPSIGYLLRGVGVSELCPCSFWLHGVFLFRPPNCASGIDELLYRLKAISHQTPASTVHATGCATPARIFALFTLPMSVIKILFMTDNF